MGAVQEALQRGIFDLDQVKIWLERKTGEAFTDSRVQELVRRVYDRWAEQDQLHRPSAKSAATRRLHDHIRRASAGAPKLDANGAQVGWLVRPDYNAVSRLEELLSKIEGTQEPARLDINISQREAIIEVIGSIDREEAEELLLEQAEADRLLAASKRGEIVVRGLEVGDVRERGKGG
jgi:hypothetical protein